MIQSPLDLWAQRHGISALALAELKMLTPDIEIGAVGNAVEEGASESRVQSQLRLEAVKYGALWRNNAGGFQDPSGRAIRYGLGNDSANFWEHWRSGDLVGVTRVVIEPQHIGRTFGVFTMIEVKHPGWNPKAIQQPSNKRERAQWNCIRNVSSMGGIAGFATSIADYQGYLERYKIGE